MTSWLVTGGAGFIGSNFLRQALKNKNTQIVVLDALTYAGEYTSISDIKDSVNFVHGDICDADLLSRLFKEHDFSHVVHFAAESHVDRSILGPEAFIKTNIEGTFHLLEAARKHWGNHMDKRFIHVSTDEVYGTLKPDEPPFTEKSLHKPNSPYAASKAAADHLVRAWGKTYGLPVIITNCSNNYGPWQYPEKLIPLMILNAIEQKPLPVYGDGLQVRDWIHVEDHCKGLLKVIEKGLLGETYVIGGNNERTNLEIVSKVCEAVDLTIGAGHTTGLIRHVEDRPGHDRRYAMDSTKLNAETGWVPEKDFGESMTELVEWYQNNPAWVEIVRAKGFQDYYKEQYANR